MAGPSDETRPITTRTRTEFGLPKPDFIVEELEAGQRKQLAERAAVAERKKTR